MKNTLIDKNSVKSGNYATRACNGAGSNQPFKRVSRGFKHRGSSEVIIPTPKNAMDHILPFFREEDLIDQDLSVQVSLEMKFQGKHLVQYTAFAKHRRQTAINICQQDIAAGIFCVLTESDTHLTVWREQPLESQKVSVKTIPALQPQLSESQPSYPKGKRISSKIEEFESVHGISLPITAVNHLAADPASQTLKTTVEPIDTSSQSAALQHKPALAAAKTKTSYTSPTPRSVFLTRFNQELTQHIGPIADYLINKLLAKRPNIQPQQMIEAIVAEIPDPKEARNIQKSLERFTHKLIETM
ncbi:MAG: hypothetical protein MJA27_27840 [Pseudanabaenales cyanobacterium]|nr:hypothetical protein [Pseudanabaenales cyanobacterium]